MGESTDDEIEANPHFFRRPIQAAQSKAARSFWEISQTLKSKSHNENVKKSSHDGQNVIFDMTQEHVWRREPQDVEEKQDLFPAKQELLDDAIT